MNNQGEQFSILDAIAIVSFLVGLANYSENVGQSQLQETVNEAVLDIHNHLKEQDEKLNFLLNKLQEKED
jgi:hypothetical protein